MLEEKIRGILKYFEVEDKLYSCKPITTGYINDTYLVFANGKALYVLQCINHKVFADIEGLMANIERALDLLGDDNYTRIGLTNTLSGNKFVLHDSEYWRLMTFIANSTTYNTTTETAIAFEAGRIIGKFHISLANERPTNYLETIPKFHDLAHRRDQFFSAIESATEEKKETAMSAILFSQKMLLRLTTKTDSQPRLRVCHNDTKLNNILFCREKQKAHCLIDLDTLMAGYFHFDFGDAVRTIVNTAPEDERDCDKITFEKPLFNAFIEGLAHNGNFLDEQEIRSLPHGVVLMPFLHGLRALTDYLNDNIYYKVTYENQNLNRCLSLFDFTEKALANENYMKSVVSKKLHPRN